MNYSFPLKCMSLPAFSSSFNTHKIDYNTLTMQFSFIYHMNVVFKCSGNLSCVTKKILCVSVLCVCEWRKQKDIPLKSWEN